MKLSEIMSGNNVFVGLKANSKRELLQLLANKASEITGINERTIFDTILERENLGSTGFGNGTALHHGRFEELNKEIGRASCRESVCQSVDIWAGGLVAEVRRR